MYVAHEFGITRIFAFKSTSVTCWGVNIPIPEMDILLESLRIIMWQCPGSTKKEPIETTLYALAIEPIETLVVQSFSHVELNNGNKTVFGPLMFLGDNMISFTSKDAILLVEITKG
ncbi:uncharacterized protein LOC124661508 [Lolium rigidum]|uniref:uncharacterized protein LOC124661508 n=1 Tax=Lolium rigidum TaxID=89674 RepID=UPI001F5E14CF|nr:uncharacterized protein LOC124661508 [Lolium rigidum]